MSHEEKSFDCVAMKNAIQRDLAEQWKGMTPQEVRKAIRRDLARSNTPAARFWRRISKSGAGGARQSAARA